MTLRRPEDFGHHFVQLRELRVHYVREGSGPPLVLWHGWPGFWWDWRNVIGPLAERFDVIAPDFRGAGDTDKTDLADVGKYSMTQLADDQAAFLDALGIPRAYVLGYDWGSVVAHKFLRRHPGRVIKAVLLDPITPGFGSMEGSYGAEEWYCVFHEYDSALNLVSLNRDSRRIYYQHFYDVWSHRQPLLTGEELEIVVENYMKPGNVHGGFNYDRANLVRGADPWTREDFEVSGIPLTVLWGLSDPAVPPAGAARLPDFYTNYTVEEIEDCGHFVMIERPDLVISTVVSSFAE